MEFEQPEYEVTVPENTRADHLLRLSARVRATGRCLSGSGIGRFSANVRLTMGYLESC